MASSWGKTRIEKAAKTGAAELDLSWCNLETIPQDVFELGALETLNLEGNRLRSIPRDLGRLKKLQRLDLRQNPLESVPSQAGLVLDWSTCERSKTRPEHVVGLRLDASLDAALEAIDSFPNLVLVDLSRPEKEPPMSPASIERVVEHLARSVPNIQGLDLFFCGLRTVPAAIAGLGRLTWLNLCGNELRTVPEGLASLRGLRYLNMSDARISRLPDWLFELPEIEGLKLGFNELRALPGAIGCLARLKLLAVGGNYLDTLPSSLRSLSRLEVLTLSHNLFATVPSVVFEVGSLRFLGLSAVSSRAALWARGRREIEGSKEHSGMLREIPSDILRLGSLRELTLRGQPIETPPQEVVNQGVSAIKDYWRQRTD